MLKIIPAIYKEGKVELLETPPEESLARIFVIFEVSDSNFRLKNCMNIRLTFLMIRIIIRNVRKNQ